MEILKTLKKVAMFLLPRVLQAPLNRHRYSSLVLFSLAIVKHPAIRIRGQISKQHHKNKEYIPVVYSGPKASQKTQVHENRLSSELRIIKFDRVDCQISGKTRLKKKLHYEE
jgi:hypothetical protein